MVELNTNLWVLVIDAIAAVVESIISCYWALQAMMLNGVKLMNRMAAMCRREIAAYLNRKFKLKTILKAIIFDVRFFFYLLSWCCNSCSSSNLLRSFARREIDSYWKKKNEKYIFLNFNQTSRSSTYEHRN